MNKFDGDNFLETLVNNFVKNFEHYSYIKIKSKNPINLFIKKNIKKKISWNEENLITTYYYNNK